MTPFKEVANSITQLFGDLNTHIESLEDLEKNFDEQSKASHRPSVAFKLNDLRSLVYSVLTKVHSYKSCCQDISEFGNSYDEDDLKTQEEMLSFLKGMGSFSSLLQKHLDGIIRETEKAESTLCKQKNSSSSGEAASDTKHKDCNASSSSGEAVSDAECKVCNASNPSSEAADSSSSAFKETQPPSIKPTAQMQPKSHEAEHKKQPKSSNFSRLHPNEQRREIALLEFVEELKKLKVEVKRLEKDAVAIYSKHITECEDIHDVKLLSDGIKQIRDKLQGEFDNN